MQRLLERFADFRRGQVHKGNQYGLENDDVRTCCQQLFGHLHERISGICDPGLKSLDIGLNIRFHDFHSSSVIGTLMVAKAGEASNRAPAGHDTWDVTHRGDPGNTSVRVTTSGSAEQDRLRIERTPLLMGTP